SDAQSPVPVLFRRVWWNGQWLGIDQVQLHDSYRGPGARHAGTARLGPRRYQLDSQTQVALARVYRSLSGFTDLDEDTWQLLAAAEFRLGKSGCLVLPAAMRGKSRSLSALVLAVMANMAAASCAHAAGLSFPVTLSADDSTFILANGIVTA